MTPIELLDIAIQPGHPLWDTAYNELKQLLQSQRNVPREWFENLIHSNSYEGAEVMLKELGIKVEK